MPIHGKLPPWGKTRHLFVANGGGGWEPQQRAWVKVDGVWEQVFGAKVTLGQICVLHFNDDPWWTYTGPYSLTLYLAGGAQPDIVTSDWKFGGASMDVTPVYDGFGNWFFRGIGLAGSADVLDFGSGDFTFDFWYKFNPGPNPIAPEVTNLDVYNMFIDGWPGGTAWPRFIYLPPWSGVPPRLSALENVGYEGGTRTYEWTPAPVADRWYHLALVRYNGNVSYYVDGVALCSYACTDTVVFSVPPGPPSIAYISVGINYGWQPGFAQVGACGKFDELRILNGVAAWTGNFTPPTHEYGN